MHEQQVAFKDCVFSLTGAITIANLDDYLKKDILNQAQSSSFYAERRRVSVDHYLGGDPSLFNRTLRLRSLLDNPALLKIEHLTPWHELIVDPLVKENMRALIANLTGAVDAQRIVENDTLTAQQLTRRSSSLQSSLGVLINGRCEIVHDVTLHSVTNCSTGCSTPVTLQSSAGFLHDRPLWYVRDPSTGFVRGRVRIDASESSGRGLTE
jgi:hypothetical protein